MNWCKCGNHGPEQFAAAFASAACHQCWLQRWHPTKMPPLPTEQKPRESLRRLRSPCVHRSAEPVRILNRCGRCKVYQCSLHGECSFGNIFDGVRDCIGCSDYATEKPAAPLGWPIRLDHRNLAPHRSGKRFNASIIDFNGDLILAYRDGWKGSEIWTIKLDRAFQPVGEPVLADMMLDRSRSPAFRLPGCSYGREDPRLFIHNGSLHLAFIGVQGRGGNVVRTNQCFARLSADRQVEDAWMVNLPNRRSWEKNWSFFDWEGGLYAIYLTHPRHIVVKIECSNATVIHDEPNPFPWSGGELRGGAPPVLVGDEFWSFVHDRITVGGRWRYRVGLYTFQATPPFRPMRMISEPILIADPSTQPTNNPNYCDVIFPCGSVRVGDDWVISSGEHDRQIRIDKFSRAELEARLVCKQ